MTIRVTDNIHPAHNKHLQVEVRTCLGVITTSVLGVSYHLETRQYVEVRPPQWGSRVKVLSCVFPTMIGLIGIAADTKDNGMTRVIFDGYSDLWFGDGTIQSL